MKLFLIIAITFATTNQTQIGHVQADIITHQTQIGQADIITHQTQIGQADIITQFKSCAKINRKVPSLEGSPAAAGSSINSFVSPTNSNYFNLATGNLARVDRKPAGIYMPLSEADVISVVRCARLNGLKIVPRGGGHSYEDFSSQDDSLVLDLSQYMNQIKIVQDDGQLGIASVQAGARLGNVYYALANRGFNFNAGTCPTVGIGGHIGGGGYGMLAREKGLAADQVVAIKIVLANGTLLTATSTDNADLFWALRGGNAGSFGVVTEYLINIFKTPQVTMFHIDYDPSVFPRLIQLFMAHFPMMDNRVTSQLQLTKYVAQLYGQFSGSKQDLINILIQTGVLDGSMQIRWQDFNDQCSLYGIKSYLWTSNCNEDTARDFLQVPFSSDPSRKDYGKYKSDFGSYPLPYQGGVDLYNLMQSSPSNDAWIQFEALGGAVASHSVSSTPYVNRDSLYSVQYKIHLEKNEPTTSQGWTWIKQVEATLRPYTNGKHYQNYPDLDIGPEYGVAYYGPENFDRLRQIKALYDPENIFTNEQAIPLPSN